MTRHYMLSVLFESYPPNSSIDYSSKVSRHRLQQEHGPILPGSLDFYLINHSQEAGSLARGSHRGLVVGMFH